MFLAPKQFGLAYGYNINRLASLVLTGHAPSGFDLLGEISSSSRQGSLNVERWRLVASLILRFMLEDGTRPPGHRKRNIAPKQALFSVRHGTGNNVQGACQTQGVQTDVTLPNLVSYEGNQRSTLWKNQRLTPSENGQGAVLD